MGSRDIRDVLKILMTLRVKTWNYYLYHQNTYTVIGKLVTCDDLNAASVTAILIREGLGCGPTEGLALSADVDNSLRNLTRELFMNHTSSNQSLNYTALGESLTCEDINPTSGNALALRNLLRCQGVNNQNSTIAS
jgi:hypothetical protein